MTAKFEAFKAALEALCIEHGMHLSDRMSDYDYSYYVISAEQASEEYPAGLGLEIEEVEPPRPLTPEERATQETEEAARRERYAAYEARCRAEHAQRIVDEEERIAALHASGDYMELQAAIEAHAKEQRKQQMRVSTDPNDPAYIDARPRKAWVNDVLIEGWVIADEFRRCVITADGKVHNGAVLVERLPAITAETGKSEAPEAPASQPNPPIDTGFVGMFEHVPDAKPEAAPVAAPAPAKKAGKRRR